MNDYVEKSNQERNETEFFDMDFKIITNHIMGRVGGQNCHEFIEIVYVNEGEVEFTIEGNDYMVECGGLILIKPGERYFVESMAQKLVRTSLKITPERIAGMSSSFKYFKKTIARILDDKKFKRIYSETEIRNSYFIDILSECSREWKDRTEGFEFIVKANITKMLVWLLRNDVYEIREEIGQQEQIAMIQKAVDYIDENYGEVTGADVASHCGLSYSYFLRIFKEVMNCGFGKYVQKKRLDESQRLLINTKKTITEIAMEVGFSTTSHFIKFFRETTGSTPKQYRNKK